MMPISDRTLHRWLRTGRPGRVGRNIENPDVAARLEAMTELNEHQRFSLEVATRPAEGFQSRTTAAVERRANTEALGVMIDLIGLGWHTTAAIAREPKSPDTSADAAKEQP